MRRRIPAGQRPGSAGQGRRRRRWLVLLCALLVTGIATPLAAQDEESSPTVTYPKEWGPNLVALDRGGRVVETSSTAAGPPDALIDGATTGDGHFWQPDWQKGFPAFFVIALAKAERLGRIQLTHRSDSASPPREIEIWLGASKDALRLAAKLELPNARVQTAEFEPHEAAAFVKVVVRSSYQEGQLEVGEAAFFAPVLGAVRGSDTKDVLEPRQGDRLLGELATETFVWKSKLGELTVKRDDLVVASLDDPKDGLDRAYLRTGEVISGELVTPKIAFRLEGGVAIEIPREKLRGIGTRRGKTEFPERPEDLLAHGHVLLLVDGGRAVGKLALDPVTLCGACGEVKLPLAAIQSIEIGAGSDGFDRVSLKGGDVLRGVIVASELPFTVSGAKNPVTLAKSWIASVLLAAEPETPQPPACDGQRLYLKTGEAISGTIALEKLRLVTGYGTIDVELASIDRIDATGGGRIKVTLRDGGLLQGRPERDPLPFDLDAAQASGAARLLVAVDRLERIENFKLPAELAKKIEDVMKRLDGEYPDREAAQAELVKIGRPALARLARVVREGSPEARTRAQAAIASIRAADAEHSSEKK